VKRQIAIDLDAFKMAVNTLGKNDQRKVLVVVLLQVFLGGLDLLGVATVGVLGSLAIRGIQSTPAEGKVGQILSLLNLDGMSFQNQVTILGLTAAALLIIRTILSVLFTRKILFFLSRRGANLSAELVAKLLSRNLDLIQQRSVQQNLYSVTSGVSVIAVGIIGTAVMIVSDAILLLMMSLGLFFVDPLVAFISFVIFGGIAIVLYQLMHVRAGKLGVRDSQLSIDSNQKITEVLKTYREAVVRDRRNFYVEQIAHIRYQLAETIAEISFMPNISKYTLESTVVIGALVISATQFIMQDAATAVATLAVFLAAGSRIAPALLRIQQGFLTIKVSLSTATPTFELIRELENQVVSTAYTREPCFSHMGFSPKIDVEKVNFTYMHSNRPTIQNVSFSLSPGATLAVVGPSGAGKTTLTDLLLGVLDPDSGVILISGENMRDVVSKWPGSVSYVPQEVAVINGSVRENIILGFEDSRAHDNHVWECLETANLRKYVEEMPQGLDTQIGDSGLILSGGQRQRLGIARALFTNPKLLVLDEATSSLDAETENFISQALMKLRGHVSLVIVAHRLSTVRNADLILYMERGEVQFAGSFEEVRKAVPNFDKQAKLMGL
jgi:ABC-type multidrug transport system fused ATPase/permease subunit